MATQAGRTINGKHFCETWTTRRGAQTLLCFIDGKQVARAKFKIDRDEAEKVETELGRRGFTEASKEGEYEMTPVAIRAELARLGLTQSGAARLVGVDPRTMRRWINGTRVMPPPAWRLLTVLDLPAVRERIDALSHA